MRSKTVRMCFAAAAAAMAVAGLSFGAAVPPAEAVGPSACKSYSAGQKRSVNHYGHYDTWVYVDQYVVGDPLNNVVYMRQVFWNKTHSKSEAVRCRY